MSRCPEGRRLLDTSIVRRADVILERPAEESFTRAYKYGVHVDLYKGYKYSWSLFLFLRCSSFPIFGSLSPSRSDSHI
jgi:hypothetical protein